jgi:hypothetical protein
MAERIRELLQRPEYRPTGAKKSRKRPGRESWARVRTEEITELFRKNRNQPLHYRRIMKEILHKIKSEPNFYEIAREILQPTEKPGYYIPWRGEENTNFDIRRSEELKELNKLRSNSQLYGFIPRKSELPKDSVIRSLNSDAPAILSDDKRFPTSFRYNPDRTKGTIIYGVTSEKSPKKGDKSEKNRKEEERTKNRDDAEKLFRTLSHATGPLNPIRFMSLIPEAFIHAFRNGKADLDLLERSRSFQDLSKDELDRVKRFAFGSAQRVYVLYTFDVNEAFDWFFENRSKKKVISQINELLTEYYPKYGAWGKEQRGEKSLREEVIENRQMAEMLMKKLRAPSKSSMNEV